MQCAINLLSFSASITPFFVFLVDKAFFLQAFFAGMPEAAVLSVFDLLVGVLEGAMLSAFDLVGLLGAVFLVVLAVALRHYYCFQFLPPVSVSVSVVVPVSSSYSVPLSPSPSVSSPSSNLHTPPHGPLCVPSESSLKMISSAAICCSTTFSD